MILEGSWEVDKRFGKQFRFVKADTKAPSTEKGKEKYLSCNLIKGIVSEMACRITAVFRETTLYVFEKDPEKLRNVPGIGPVRAGKISQAFSEQKDIRDIILFLQSHTISPAYAYIIFKKYGKLPIEAVSQNPYSLATDIK